MNWGSKSEHFALLETKGYAPPLEFLNPPQLLPENTFTYEAFWEVNSDRHVGMGIGAIPFSAIDSYADRYGISSIDRFDSLRRAIRVMDDEYRRLTAPPDKNKPVTVAATDATGVKSLLMRLGDQAKASAKPHLKPPPKEG